MVASYRLWSANQSPSGQERVLGIFERVGDLVGRLGTYSVPGVMVELIIIWLVVLIIVRFVQGTRAAGAIKGVLMVLLVATVIVQIVGGGAALPRIALLYDRLLAVVAIGLVVIFQPELRRALIRLGETPLLGSNKSTMAQVVDPIVEASAFLSKARFGAIIVIERRVGLSGLVEGGTQLDAQLSSRVLQTIFFPGTALHDLAVVIRGAVVHAAGVQLPMADADEMPDPTFGARHRAAVGLTKECDALVVVVSEETGNIRLVERGRLGEALDAEGLREALRLRLGRVTSAKTAGDAAQEREDTTVSERVADPVDDADDNASDSHRAEGTTT